MADSLWRARLRPASFRGVRFNIEVGARAGGRRLVPHEFPKRDTPYAEDMGRKGRTFPVTAYLVGSEYQVDRDDLIDALEAEGPGLLVHPTFGEFQVVCGPYTCVERRERGGFCEFDIQFIEAGDAGIFTPQAATQEQAREKADEAEGALVTSGNKQMDTVAV